jgi:hypothetical protein
MVAPAPSMYSSSLAKNIVPKVEYLARLWGGDDRTKDVTKFGGRRNSLSGNLCKYPVILTLSLEDNIIPMLLFFNVMGYIGLDVNGMPQMNELPMHQRKVIIQSCYIATSLYNRFLPRWHFLLQEQEIQQPLLWYTRMRSRVARDTSAYADALVLWDLLSSSNPTPLPPLHLWAGANDSLLSLLLSSPPPCYAERSVPTSRKLLLLPLLR